MTSPLDEPDSMRLHPTERERAIRGAMLGIVLGTILALVSRRRTA